MRAVLTFGLLILASVFVQGLTAQTAPTATIGGVTTDFIVGTGVDFQVTLAPGAGFSTAGTIRLTETDGSQIITLDSISITGAPTGITAPTTPTSGTSGNDLDITWTGSIAASNAPGNYDYTVNFSDTGTVPNTGSITVRIILTDTTPVHSANASASGDGSSGTPYAPSSSSAKGSSAALPLADITDGNTAQTLTAQNITFISGPAGYFTAGFDLTSTTSPTTLQANGYSTLDDGAVGVHVYDIDISDGTNTVTVRASITVVNATPVLAQAVNNGSGVVSHGGSDPLWTGTAVVGQDIEIQIDATDADSTDLLQITATVNGSSTGTGYGAGPFTSTQGVSTNSLVITGTAGTVGDIILDVVVTDNSGVPATDTYTFTLTISAVPPPTIVAAPSSLTAFTTTGIGVASSEQTFTVSGTDLTANLVVTPPTGFQIGTSSGSLSTSAISLAPSSGTVGSTTIFVAYNPPAGGGHSGTIDCTSTSAATQTVSVSGSITGGAGQVTIGDAPSHPGGAQSASPGNSRSTLAFRLTETAGSSFDLTGATVNIAMTNNGGGVAAAAITSVRISRGGTLATITNGGAGWSATATDITLAFTFSASTVNASSNGDFVVTINFAGGAAPKPSPAYIGSISNGNLTGSGSVTNTATVTGGQITLKNTTPSDPFADDDDDGSSCDLTTSDAPSWLAMLLLMFALVSIGAIKRRKA